MPLILEGLNIYFCENLQLAGWIFAGNIMMFDDTFQKTEKNHTLSNKNINNFSLSDCQKHFTGKYHLFVLSLLQVWKN